MYFTNPSPQQYELITIEEVERLCGPQKWRYPYYYRRENGIYVFCHSKPILLFEVGAPNT